MRNHHADQGGDMKYPNVSRFVAETPWAILKSKLDAIVEVVALRASGGRLTDDQIAARLAAVAPQRNQARAASVALLPLYGTIIPRADAFEQMSGGTSVEGFQGMFRDALADDDVTAIVIDIDSPGGSADLVPELAREIRAARGAKPIVAVANTLAASAAYWIGAQADEFVATPSALVGSIGVYSAHTDLSEALKEAGVKITYVDAGKHKTELMPSKPLTAEAKQGLQEIVDDCYAMFVEDVAAGRRTTVESVRNGFGQGRVVHARAALAEGMIDRIETLEAAVGRLLTSDYGGGGRAANTSPAQAATSGLSFADEAEAARGAALALVERAGSLARLTGSKREQLDAVAAAHREVAETIAATAAQSTEEQTDDDPGIGLEAEHVFARLLHQ
jgi:capsid assembly protease